MSDDNYAIDNACQMTMEAIANRNYSMIDSYIQIANAYNSSVYDTPESFERGTEYRLALLRFSFSVRHLLANWKELRLNVWNRLAADPTRRDRLMVGLYET